jgi:hypothetical protein
MSPAATPNKSTNVRLYDAGDGEAAVSRSLALALALWAGTIALAAFDGVFLRLGAAMDTALALFALAFAAATYLFDREVRAWVDRAPLAALALLALAGDASLAWAAAQRPMELVQGANALLAFLALPLALAAHAPAASAIARRFRRAPGRSPGASPAAT